MKAKINNSLLFEQKVRDIVSHKIRPQLQQHGGDLAIKDIKNGSVWVVFNGACKTCPSAKFTAEDIVEGMLRAELKEELKEVYLVNETDAELLSFAKKLLNDSYRKNELERNI